MKDQIDLRGNPKKVGIIFPISKFHAETWPRLLTTYESLPGRWNSKVPGSRPNFPTILSFFLSRSESFVAEKGRNRVMNKGANGIVSRGRENRSEIKRSSRGGEGEGRACQCFLFSPRYATYGRKLNERFSPFLLSSPFFAPCFVAFLFWLPSSPLRVVSRIERFHARERLVE